MTGMSESLRLAELLCARLCHDLSGPLGALIGILEIAREEQPEGETLALAEDTANELVQRLKLLRAAWGQDSDDMDVARLRGFAECLSSSRRVLLDLAGLEPGATIPAAGRPRRPEPVAAGRREPARRRHRGAFRLARTQHSDDDFRPSRRLAGRPGDLAQ